MNKIKKLEDGKNGWIYLIKSNGFIKAGITKNNLKNRIKNYDTHNPNGVEIIRAYYVQNPQIIEVEINNLIKKVNSTDWGTTDNIDYIMSIIDSYNDINKVEKVTSSFSDDIRRKVLFSQSKVPFTQVANTVLNDKNISFRAKGLFAYLYSKPDGWDFSYIRISNDCSESKNTVLKTLQELEEFGYLERVKLKTGRIEYYLDYQPETKDWSLEPETKISRDQNQQRPKIGHISNTKGSKVINMAQSNKESSFDEKFDKFWEEYPKIRRFDKKNCKKKFLAYSEKEGLADRIIADVIARKESVDWVKDNYQFVCAPIVYLNQRRWEAEIIRPKDTTKTIDINELIKNGKS